MEDEVCDDVVGKRSLLGGEIPTHLHPEADWHTARQAQLSNTGGSAAAVGLGWAHR